jgi:hypothetical protein
MARRDPGAAPIEIFAKAARTDYSRAALAAGGIRRGRPDAADLKQAGR